MSNIYQQLRERIDQYSVGMAATESGKELKILQRLFTEEEARIYLIMTRSLESAQTIASRAGINAEHAANILNQMTEKGLTFPLSRDGVRYYAAAPLMHGFFEHQVFRKKADSDLPKLLEDYLLDGFVPKTFSLRTVPVKVNIDANLPVLPYDDVKRIIEGKNKIGLFKCACSYQVEQVGKGCGRSHEMCIAFDFYAEYVIEEMKFGRYITQEEALQILDEAEAMGLVHQTGGDTRNCECICNCCPECCTILRRLKLLPAPGQLKSSNYMVVFDAGQCDQCLTCIDRCPMAAIIEDGGLPILKQERCIGCGLCTTTCPTGAKSLRAKPQGDIKPPPETFTFMRSTIDLERELAEEISRNK
ncbi:MAG: 4Fe-4S binding protein [Candidatus Saccharibacteria bacterium]